MTPPRPMPPVPAPATAPFATGAGPGRLAGILAAALLSLPAGAQVPRGATVPWTAYEAEDGRVGGAARVIGPGRLLGTPEGEASGRRAVMLERAGDFVEWTVSKAANAFVVRYSIPDAPGGGGIEATLGLYVNGTRREGLRLTSAHSWVYGDWNTQGDTPGPGPRKLYGEANLLLKGYVLNPGDVIRLQKDASDAAAHYAVDFIELEQAAPALPQPAGYCSVTDGSLGWKAAVPDDGAADDEAFNRCIQAAQEGRFQGVYIPPGLFHQDRKFETRKVKIQGAGLWHSRIYCPNRAPDGGPGNTGFILRGGGGEFRDFAIFGWGGTRTQGGKAFAGAAFTGTIIERLWIENVHCGYWSGGNEESIGLVMRHVRFRNIGADAVNLCNGNRDALIEHCHARNTGDDAFAIWSAANLFKAPCTNNTIRNCTVQITWRAACFAVYGGRGNRIENCLGQDAITYPGLTVSSEAFSIDLYPMEGVTVDGLTLNRCGGTYWDASQHFGAVWLYSADRPFANATLRNLEINDPFKQGIHFQSKSHPMNQVAFENVTINRAGQIGVQVKAGSMGGATFRALAVNGGGRIVNHAGAAFTVSDLLAGVRRIAVPAPGRSGKSSVAFTVPPKAGGGASRVRVSLFGADGRERAVLADGTFAPGAHEVAVGVREREACGAGPCAAALKVEGGPWSPL